MPMDMACRRVLFGALLSGWNPSGTAWGITVTINPMQSSPFLITLHPRQSSAALAILLG
jgi:hypothetical protein